jgi:hypothetical protein
MTATLTRPLRNDPDCQGAVSSLNILTGKESDPFPDIITFTVHKRYLNRPNLYPRQATLLKVMFLGVDPYGNNILTDYDYKVMNEWMSMFAREGDHGIVTDLEERMEINRAAGRHWFREVVAVAGRRASKGHIGAIAGAYILAWYLRQPNPQEFYGVDRSKTMAALVFAGKKGQARDNQWKDLVNMIIDAPHFRRRVSRSLGQSLSIYSDADLARMEREAKHGFQTSMDRATFEIIPKESTVMAGRGPAAFMQFYDEMAHSINTGATREATEVYEAAVPSLDQFGKDAFIYEPSSPWQKTGQFYTNYEKALERVAEDGYSEGNAKPAYPEVLMFQLESWDLYEDWWKAHTLPMLPRDRRDEGEFRSDYAEPHDCNPKRGDIPAHPFPEFQGAIQEYDEDMKKLERMNPDTFRVERRAKFATVMDAYLNEARVDSIFAPWNGREIVPQARGALNRLYRAHGDPSKSGANFGWAIAHIEHVPGQDLPHVVFDKLHAWLPQNFPDHNIDYEQVTEDIKVDVTNFMPGEVTFDQFNSIGTIQSLNRWIARHNFPKRIVAYERTATAPLNWKTYETFKTAVNLGLVHAPEFELAMLELKYLQDLGGKVDHPTLGPVQTKDVADCMAIVVYSLIGDHISAFIGQALSESSSFAPAMEGGMTPSNHMPGADAPVNDINDISQRMSDFSRGNGGRGGGSGDPSRGRTDGSGRGSSRRARGGYF